MGDIERYYMDALQPRIHPRKSDSVPCDSHKSTPTNRCTGGGGICLRRKCVYSPPPGTMPPTYTGHGSHMYVSPRRARRRGRLPLSEVFVKPL